MFRAYPKIRFPSQEMEDAVTHAVAKHTGGGEREVFPFSNQVTQASSKKLKKISSKPRSEQDKLYRRSFPSYKPVPGRTLTSRNFRFDCSNIAPWNGNGVNGYERSGKSRWRNEASANQGNKKSRAYRRPRAAFRFAIVSIIPIKPRYASPVPGRILRFSPSADLFYPTFGFLENRCLPLAHFQ